MCRCLRWTQQGCWRPLERVRIAQPSWSRTMTRYDVVADGKCDCALAIDPPLGRPGCCSCVDGTLELKTVTSCVDVRAASLSVSADLACGVGIAGPVSSGLSAETVGVSAGEVEGDGAGRLNLFGIVHAVAAGAACLLRMMCFA